MANSPLNSSVSAQDGSLADPRRDSQHVLATRRAPAIPSGPAGALTDRMLVHTSWATARRLLSLVSWATSGLVLRGSRAGAGVRELRMSGCPGVLVIDPEGYTRGPATVEAPFVLPEPGLFAITLEDVLQAQRDCGATIAVTPTGYLHAGDSDALEAAVGAVAAMDRDDVPFSVPLDVAWLTNDHISQLITILTRLSAPKAVLLGAQFNPLDRYNGIVANLRRLVADAGHVAVFRTDLTGFDALTHGAFAASIGTGGSLRHVIPYGQHPRASAKDESPSVLFGQLMNFFKGSTIAERFENRQPPGYSCSTCHGQSLSRFRTKRDRQAAEAHGVCTWTGWIPDLLAQPTLADRARWWRSRCATAVAQYDAINAELNHPDAFTPSKALRAWAELPLWPSVTEMASQRSLTR